MSRRKRAVFLAASLLWASVIFWVSSIPASGLPSDMGYWTNVGHFLEYLILAVLIALTLRKQDGISWKTALLTITIASLYGASDEFHQWFVAGRYTDVFDWLADTAGAIAGTSIVVFTVRAFTRKTEHYKTEVSK
jgi:VanZ family protein